MPLVRFAILRLILRFRSLMKKLLSYFLCIMIPCSASAQEYLLTSPRWSDVTNHTTRNIPAEISIDSTMITITQSGTNIYLEITKKQRTENVFTYEVIDANDQQGRAIFSPEEMTFDYSAGEFKLRYFIDNIQLPNKEQEKTEAMAKDTTTAENDTATVKEDVKIYETADVMPEFPGGKEAMNQFLTSNLKYPAAAKRDNLKGIVTVTAVVEKNGTLSEVTIKRDVGGGCGAEAVRVIKQMPTWIPGQIKNEDKRVRVTISIFFPPK